MLDQTITLAEVSHVVIAIKNNKAAGSDGTDSKLVTYGCKPMYEMLLTLFNLVWNNEFVSSNWRDGLILTCTLLHGKS